MVAAVLCWAVIGFQSTRPRRGATLLMAMLPPEGTGFNPRAPGGAQRGAMFVHIVFQSTRPRRGATMTHWRPVKGFNPRAPGGARPRTVKVCKPDKEVSIHAPPEGRDSKYGVIRVSIHAPPEGRDMTPAELIRSCFNPRAPGGARRDYTPKIPLRYFVSIHAPPEGRDAQFSPLNGVQMFQSTRPRRGATKRSLD